MRVFGSAVLMALSAIPLASCATTSEPAAPHAEARSYDTARDAEADVSAALTRAAASGRRVLLVMGANWCHDSRALAGTLATSRFQAALDSRYELVFVNVGMPQTGDGHNLDIADRYGVTIEGTPAVLIIGPDGVILNRSTAASWRNAGSRTDDAIYQELFGVALSEGRSPSG